MYTRSVGVGLGAIGAHAITKRSDEMKDVWKVRDQQLLSSFCFMAAAIYAFMMSTLLDRRVRCIT